MTTKYDREILIGSGTFGHVWLVRSRCSGLQYVLKEVQLKSMSSTERQQALTEVTVLSTCRHRNIIRYKEASIGYERGILSIIMEYADGGDLYTLIRRQKGCYFDEKDVLSWFVQITFALQYIHSRSILHRDLKSKNIFLTKAMMVKVGDFGIARVLSEESELATTAIGTPYYLSPEICQRKSYNQKSDIWALGCVLFEMSALVHPFQAQNFHQLVSAILQVKYRALPNHCGNLVRELVSLLLHKDPKERPFAEEILSIPALLPHIRRYCESLPDTPNLGDKSNHFKVAPRRFSSNDLTKGIKEAEKLKRRASMSVKDQRKPKFSEEFDIMELPKTCLNKDSVVSAQVRSISIPRPIPTKMKTGKTSPLTNIAKVRNGYRHHQKSSPSNSSEASKESDVFPVPNATYILGKSQQESDLCPIKRCAKTEKNHCPRQTTCSPKTNFQPRRPLSSSEQTVPQTNLQESPKSVEAMTIKYSASTSDSDCVFDDAKEVCSARSHLQAKSAEEGKACPHVSQCRQCMVDTMWKNRIRVDSSLHLDHNERQKLRAELQSVFGAEKFRRMYKTLASEWEGCGDPSSLHGIFQSMDLEQGQYIPLFLQLVQVDLLSKALSVQSIKL